MVKELLPWELAERIENGINYIKSIPFEKFDERVHKENDFLLDLMKQHIGCEDDKAKDDSLLEKLAKNNMDIKK